MNEHLSEQEIAAYVDGGLAPDARARIESHVGDCAECGEDLVQASRTIRAARRGRRIKTLTPYLAAAAVVALLFGVSQSAPVTDEGPLLRDGASDETLVRVVQPPHRSILARDSLLFVWRGLNADASYTFTLTDPSGDILWEQQTADTVVSLNRDVALRPGATYFWYVDATFGDGRTADSGTLQVTAGR